MYKRLFALLLLALPALTARAETYALPPADVDLIGQIRVVQAEHDDTLLDIARRHSLGYEEIVIANPGVDIWLPGEGTEVVLPTRYILPDTPREGLVLNVAELRLYYYPKPKAGEPPVVKTFPVSIGRMDWKTPLGTTQVVAKVKDPAWYPPASIKREHAERGDILPDVVPPGPDNPLGQHAMRLGIPGYLIHGTNRPSGIGMRVTHGCVRMYPEDIASLFPEVPQGTRVTIVNQPMKSGWLADSLFVEYHDPLDEDNNAYKVSLDEAVAAVVNKAGPFAERIQPDAIAAVVARGSGMPVPVTLDRHTVPVDRRPSPMDDRRQSVELIDLYSRPY